MSKYGVISGPYFPVFGLNTGKSGPEITPCLDTFHAVSWKVTLFELFFELLIFNYKHPYFYSLVLVLKNTVHFCWGTRI